MDRICNTCSKLKISTTTAPLTGNKHRVSAKCTKYAAELQASAAEDSKIDLHNLPDGERTPGIIVFMPPKCKGRESWKPILSEC